MINDTFRRDPLPPGVAVSYVVESIEVEREEKNGMTWDNLPRCEHCGRWCSTTNYKVIDGYSPYNPFNGEPPEPILICPNCYRKETKS